MNSHKQLFIASDNNIRTLATLDLPDSRHSGWRQQFDQLLERHLNKPILTNEFLANELGISERKLYRKIKKLTGQTPNRYIRTRKLQRAHDFLSSGKHLTVKEVVPKIGLKSVKYFYSIFKQQYGYPPGDILRKGGFK